MFGKIRDAIKNALHKAPEFRQVDYPQFDEFRKAILDSLSSVNNEWANQNLAAVLNEFGTDTRSSYTINSVVLRNDYVKIMFCPKNDVEKFVYRDCTMKVMNNYMSGTNCQISYSMGPTFAIRFDAPQDIRRFKILPFALAVGSYHANWRNVVLQNVVNKRAFEQFNRIIGLQALRYGTEGPIYEENTQKMAEYKKFSLWSVGRSPKSIFRWDYQTCFSTVTNVIEEKAKEDKAKLERMQNLHKEMQDMIHSAKYKVDYAVSPDGTAEPLKKK